MEKPSYPVKDIDKLKIISIHGVPRSGTSWIGQIFNSHPDVTYRYQPLFSYRFKNRINSESSKLDIYSFLEELYSTNSDKFMSNKKEISQEIYPKFSKNQPAAVLVMKMVRYHHLIEKLISEVKHIKILGIVRHPCAVINSWFQAPKEFQNGWSPLKEWRYAPSKNQGRIEEFYGYEKWKEVAYMFLELKRKYPEKFYLLRYEDLMENITNKVQSIFNFSGLDDHTQVCGFLRQSHQIHNNDPYAVFKNPRVKDRWNTELNPAIAERIIADLSNTELAEFIR